MMAARVLAGCILAATAAFGVDAISSARARGWSRETPQGGSDDVADDAGTMLSVREFNQLSRDLDKLNIPNITHGKDKAAPAQLLDTLGETDSTSSAATLYDSLGQLASRADHTKKVLVDAAAEFARKPVEVLKAGVPVLTARARIATDVFSKAMADSVQMLMEGDMSGALQAAGVALANYQKTVDSGTSGAASKSIGILLVFLVIGVAWVMELLLTLTGRRSQTESDAQHQTEEKIAVRAPPFFHALSFIRYFFIWLAVFDSFYNPGRQTSAEATAVSLFSRWGCLAYPWFFLVSGFSNSYSKIVGPKPEEQLDWFICMVRSVSSWYPFYAAALIACASRSWSTSAEDWSHYLGNMFLINGVIWSESSDGSSYPNAMVGQWLSFLTFYMMCWSPMHHVLRSSTNSVIWTLLTIACLCAIPSAINDWYFLNDWPPLMLMQYWPSFCFGQALATWFVRNCMQERVLPGRQGVAWVKKPEHEVSLTVKFGPTASILFLGICAFSFSPYDRLPLVKKPVAPILLKGGLLPLMGVLVVGMAYQVDPVAKFFARKPFRLTEKLCLLTFMLQAPIQYTVVDMTGWKGLSWAFVTGLVAASILGHAFLEQPWRQLLRLRAK